MIYKLQSGEYLKKDWLNAVAEKTNAEVPSTGSFINTTNGTLFDPGTSNTVTNYRPFVETMFQCSYCAAFEISARNDDAVDEFDTSKTRLTFKMRLGPTVSDIKSNVKYEETLDDVFILNNDQPNMTICLSDNKILSSAMTNNYIDLAAYDKSEVEVKVIKVELSSEQQQQQTQRKPLYVLGIGPAGKTSYEEILERQQYSQYDKATVVKSCTVAKLDNNKKMYQLEIGVIDLRKSTDVKIPDGDSDVNWQSEELSTVEPRLSSIHRNEISGTSYYQLYQFGLSDNVQLSDLSDVQADVLVRKIDGKDHTLEYVALSALSVSSSEKISVDTQVENQTSSIQLLSTQVGEWYQLYNFDKANADIDAKIWTLGDLDSEKHGKTGKLIDPKTKKLLSVDILVRDNSTKQLKYMNLSVDPINVDTFSTNTTQKSLTYYKDKFQDRDYLSLRDFNTTPDTKLTTTISGNGLVDITGKNTWILTKKYNTANQMMELTYDKLQLSVDLSGVSADVRCDADVTLAQKSIQKKGDYIQLYNFTRPSITTKKTTIDKLSATYDLLDSNDSVLVRSGTELKYKKLQIETKLPSSGGGGGETTGYTGSVDNVTRIYWDTSEYKIKAAGVTMTYENGLLKSISAEKTLSQIDTVGYSGT